MEKHECDFKYGETLEFSDNENFKDYRTGEFLAFHPKERDGDCYADFDGCLWAYARRPLPNIKEGAPVITYVADTIPTIRIFSHFNEKGNIEVYPGAYFESENGNTIEYKKYKLLEHYDYDA